MNKDQLIEQFSSKEVETTDSLLACMDGPPTPSKFRRVIMLFLRGHYSSAENYDAAFKHLACYTWDPDDKVKTLAVDYTSFHRDDYPEDYPGIYVGFGGVRLTKLGFGDVSSLSEDMAQTRLSKQSDLTLIVEHVAPKSHDAWDLADMSTAVLEAMGEPLAKRSGAMAIEVEGYAPPSRRREAPERYYTVAMPIRISYTHGVTRYLESHRIKRIASVLDAET